MFDASFLLDMLSALYPAEGATIESLGGLAPDRARAVVRVRLPDGAAWVVRAYPVDAPVPDWLVGCDARTTQEWLASRAATLAYLAGHGYPAPRVIATRAGAAVGLANGWCTLATTYIPGTTLAATPASLRQLGATLGRLHCVPLAPESAAVLPGKSWWYPATAIPAILAQYDSMLDTLPEQWRAAIDTCRAALQTIAARPELPPVVVHGDAWLGNAIQTREGEVVLIDWEPSGLGLAVLDLGRLLLYGHLEEHAPLASPIEPSGWRIAAIARGYREQRAPTAAERALLAEAIRFGVAIGAATHFTREQRAGWPEPPPERLTRRQHWLAISDTIARLAERELAG